MQDHLLDKGEVCRFFGNIHPSSLWRGIKVGRFPPPIHIGPQLRRWSREACETALREMTEARS
jgi:predicted DNA-binding transcriptional regulator AlpA